MSDSRQRRPTLQRRGRRHASPPGRAFWIALVIYEAAVVAIVVWVNWPWFAGWAS